MEGIHIINILLMENEKSGKSIVELLKDFSNNQQIELSVFNDANKLVNSLKHFTIYFGSYKHNIVLFHSRPPLNNVIKVIKEIKESPDLKTTPVFIITESRNKKEIKKAYDYYTNSVIIKPHNMEGIIQIINSFKELWFKHVQLP